MGARLSVRGYKRRGKHGLHAWLYRAGSELGIGDAWMVYFAACMYSARSLQGPRMYGLQTNALACLNNKKGDSVSVTQWQG